MMFRVYTSTVVLVCVVTQALTDVQKRLCKRQLRFYQQVSKQAPRVCKITRRHCFTTFPRPSCYYIAEYYECMYVQYKQTAKIKQVYTCCDGYSYRNDKCEKEDNTFVLNENDEATFPKADIIGKLPQPKLVCGSEGWRCQFVFPCGVTKYGI